LELHKFNALRKSLGREHPIEYQRVSASAPKLFTTSRADRTAFGKAAARVIFTQ
jgi:hypothetical protein